MKLQIKVIPGSSQNCIAGWLGDILKIRVTALAEKGKANNEVEKIIAAALGLPHKNIYISTGKSSPRKVVDITGMDESDVYKKLLKSDD